MTRAEARRVAIVIFCAAAGFMISLLGLLLTGESEWLGWVLAPGVALVLIFIENNEYAGFLIFGCMVLNVSLWSLVVYIIGDQVAKWRRRRNASAVESWAPDRR